MLYFKKILLEQSDATNRPLKTFEFNGLTSVLKAVFENSEYAIMKPIREKSREVYLNILPKDVAACCIKHPEYFTMVNKAIIYIPEIKKRINLFGLNVPVANNIGQSDAESYVGNLIQEVLKRDTSALYFSYNRMYKVGEYYNDLVTYISLRNSTIKDLYLIDRFAALVLWAAADIDSFYDFVEYKGSRTNFDLYGLINAISAECQIWPNKQNSLVEMAKKQSVISKFLLQK